MSRQLTINDILKMFLAHIKLIIIMAIVGTILAYVYVSYFVTPVYTTTALLLVQNNSNMSQITSSDDGNVEVDTSNITQSAMLANTCTTLFRKDPDMKAIIAGNSVSITAIEDSYFLEVKVSSSDPLAAANVANQVAEAAPEVFAKYFGEAGRVDTVDEAAIPSSPSSPNVSQYVMMGFLAGLILALAIAFLMEVVDTTVKPGDDLYDIYKIPVFAEIIDFEMEGGARKR
ncbi:MAG: hypothetical protein IJD68_07250 [Ruminococcus sp.]|nr:hypothetical protein [Ruminococcus sp.]